MSDQIFKLGRQATIWCCDNLNPDTSKEDWDAAWEQKFAELIIKDCISQIAIIGLSNEENEDISWAVDLAILNIKDRFGVK